MELFMKKSLVVLSFMLVFYAGNSFAKRSFFQKIETGLSITSKVIAGISALNDLASESVFVSSSRSSEVKTRVVYKDRIIYKEVEKPSAEAQELKTKLANSQRKLAWEKARDKKHETALKLYEKSLEYDANNWMTWHGYGWSFSELKRYAEARNAFLMAIKLGAKDESWRYLGWNYARQGYHKEAVRCYAEAIKINPDNEQAYIGLKASKKSMGKEVSKGSRKHKSSKKSSEKWFKVTATPSLTVRSKPSVKGKKIGNLDYDSLVKVIKYVGKWQTIGGKRAHWAKIQFNNKPAYVFSAHLKKY